MYFFWTAPLIVYHVLGVEPDRCDSEHEHLQQRAAQSVLGLRHQLRQLHLKEHNHILIKSDQI